LQQLCTLETGTLRTIKRDELANALEISVFNYKHRRTYERLRQAVIDAKDAEEDAWLELLRKKVSRSQ
jgi:hypothetical protein